MHAVGEVFADNTITLDGKQRPFKGWGRVAFADVGVVEGAFGVDAVGAVLLAGAPP
ncbi:MAG: hypothetical protein ACRDTN_09745 [Mycobacterium sp.]